MKTRQITLALVAAFILAACQDATQGTISDPVRSVVLQQAEPASPVRARVFPAVLQPPEVTPLAFDVGGRLGPLALRIGQEVEAGDVLATVSADDATLRLQQAEAALLEAQTASSNARTAAQRQQTLFDRDVVAAAARDEAVARADQADARVIQARRNLDLLEESLDDTTLRAPFNAVIDGIAVQAFASVQPGQPVVTLYEDAGLQATIFVSYDVVTNLELGQRVNVTPADGAYRALSARVTEIGRRAAAVSSFPIVVSLDETHPNLRSGMAVEISVDLPVPEARHGIEIPLSAVALNRAVAFETLPRQAEVFVARPIDDGLGTVEPVQVELSAVAQTSVFVASGLEPGDLVVTAGVSFLNPGQTVRLPTDVATQLADAKP